MLRYKENFEQIRESFEAYWLRENTDRCLLSIRTPREGGKQIPFSKAYTLSERYADPQCLHEAMLNSCEQTDFLYEAIPVLMPNFGTAAECEFFGCKQGYAEDTIWFEPVLYEPDVGQMKMDPEAIKRQQKITKQLTQLAGKDYLVGMNDNCGIIDGLAHIRGTENLLMDMIENPEFVHAARDNIIDVWKKTQAEIFAIVKENNFGGSSHSWMQLWSPKRHLQLQCDYCCMISPEMFEEFVLPELEETASAFEHITYHLDGVEQIRHLDMILSVKGIDNIQWTHVAGQPNMCENIESLQKIQKAGKGLVLLPTSNKEIPFLLENLSPKGLMMSFGVNSMEEAVAYEKMARDAAKKYR